ncbi:hypothetical protein AMAG_12577 [Allomyces macrogynus ATCC 38327]|uniref:U2A'/phosphoprotein 32 family A C-terminal domain-containing protein n=1 Tax=Allomyces macrogynus (strain ATCC 38327) TaxID=578462 RepID=A0A0L0SZL8_ALLM3|nr:hypothetical protein AMAG_12577 [Allomyces macrogynus ATCC 38327]|eukprot:KNE67860.1 hypothetical protein AMAG_12577 [Allomyces macrogynus ATCC 38327]
MTAPEASKHGHAAKGAHAVAPGKAAAVAGTGKAPMSPPPGLGPFKVLTEAQVLAKANVKSLAEMTELNVWGAQLDDVSLVQRMPNLKIASLSQNHIATLAPFASLAQLQELYLRGNHIGELTPQAQDERRPGRPAPAVISPLVVLERELKHLQGCKKLSVLWLAENPCAQHGLEYRNLVIRMLPQLKQLDKLEIKPAERKAAAAAAAAAMHEHEHIPAPAPAGTHKPMLPPASLRTAAVPNISTTSPTSSAPTSPKQAATSPKPAPLTIAPHNAAHHTTSTQFSPQDVRSVLPNALSRPHSPDHHHVHAHERSPSPSSHRRRTSTANSMTVRPGSPRVVSPGHLHVDPRVRRASVGPFSPQDVRSVLVPEIDALGMHPPAVAAGTVSGPTSPRMRHASMPATHVAHAHAVPHVHVPGGGGHNNVLFAVMALVRDLEPGALRVVHQEVGPYEWACPWTMGHGVSVAIGTRSRCGALHGMYAGPRCDAPPSHGGA